MNDEISIEELKKLADDGNVDAKIEYATECIGKNIDTEANMAYLESMAAQDNTRALINLGFIYCIDRKEEEKAEPYFIRAAELGSTYAMFITGNHAYLKCHVWYITKDDPDAEKSPAPTADDFLHAQKWLEKALSELNDDTADCDLEDLPKWAKEWLEELYSMKCEQNPIYKG